MRGGEEERMEADDGIDGIGGKERGGKVSRGGEGIGVGRDVKGRGG